MAEVDIRLFLAASDWQTIAAIVVFTLISIVANWVKKRSEAAHGQTSAEGDADDEFEPVELFEEPKPKYKPPPVARPTAPPILVVERRPIAPPSARPGLNRSLVSEAQNRVSSALPMPKVSMVSASGRPGARAAQKARRPAIPQPAVAEIRQVEELDLLNLRNQKSLRQAFIATELLRPPVALRGLSDVPGLSP